MRNMNLRTWILTGVAVFLGWQGEIGICSAESVYSYVSTYYHTDYIENQGEPFQDLHEESTTAANAMVQIDVDGAELMEGIYDVYALANTSYGIHHLQANANVTNANKEIIHAEAYSMWEDDWIVRAPEGETTGEMTIGILLYGNQDEGGADYYYNGLYYDFDCEGAGCAGIELDGKSYLSLNTENFTWPQQVITITIYYNVDAFFTVTSSMEVTVHMFNYEENMSGYSSIDFGNSAALTTLTLPPGHTLETASGTQYPLDYTPPDTNNDTDPPTTSGGGGGGGGCFISSISK